MERRRSPREHGVAIYTYFASSFSKPIIKFRKNSTITEKFRHISNLYFTKRHRHDDFGLVGCDTVSLGKLGPPEAETEGNTIFRYVGNQSTKCLRLNRSSDTPLR